MADIVLKKEASINKSQIMKLRATFLLSCIWVVFYVIAVFGGRVNDLSNVGINFIGTDYYRIITGMLLHANIIHMLSNILSLYWIGVFIEEYLGSSKLFVLSLVSGAMSNLIFAIICKDNQGSIGGSVINFSLIGFIIFSQLFDEKSPRLKLKTWCGNWILCYSILSNIPLFGGNMTRIIIHIIASVVGFICSSIIHILKVTTKSQ